jgi:hypothetical protein
VVGAVAHKDHSSPIVSEGAVFRLQKLRRLPVVLQRGEQRSPEGDP